MSVGTHTIARPQPTKVDLPERRRAWQLALFVPLVIGPLWGILGIQVSRGHVLASWTGCILLLLLAICAYTDLNWRRIFNWATYPAFLWGVFLNLLDSFLVSPSAPEGMVDGAFPVPGVMESFLGTVGLGSSLLGGVVCFVVMLLVYRLAGGGAGDVKLAAAIGALLGVQQGLNALIWTYAVAGVVLGAWFIWKVGPLTLIGALIRRVGHHLFPRWVLPVSTEQGELLRTPIPLAEFFAVGTLIAVLGGDIPW